MYDNLDVLEENNKWKNMYIKTLDWKVIQKKTVIVNSITYILYIHYYSIHVCNIYHIYTLYIKYIFYMY